MTSSASRDERTVPVARNHTIFVEAAVKIRTPIMADFTDDNVKIVLSSRIEELCTGVTREFYTHVKKVEKLYHGGKMEGFFFEDLKKLATIIPVKDSLTPAAFTSLVDHGMKQHSGGMMTPAEYVAAFQNHYDLAQPLLPLDLVMKHDKVIIRPGGRIELTDQMRKRGTIKVDVPFVKYKKGNKTHGVTVTVFINTTEMIKLLINRGGHISYLRFLPPVRGSDMPRANVAIVGDPAIFTINDPEKCTATVGANGKILIPEQVKKALGLGKRGFFSIYLDSTGNKLLMKHGNKLDPTTAYVNYQYDNPVILPEKYRKRFDINYRDVLEFTYRWGEPVTVKKRIKKSKRDKKQGAVRDEEDIYPRKIYRIERIWLKPDKNIGKHCHVAKNLYNEANFIVRQWFFKERKWLRYTTLNWLLKDVKQSENYKELSARTSQQTLRLLDQNWKSFFASIKDWKKNPHKYLGRPKLPKYLDKNGELVLLFTNQQVKLKDGYLIFPRKIGLRLKTRLPENTDLGGARIVPKGTGYVAEIIYKKNIPRPVARKNRIAGIDIGLNNLVTLVSNTGTQPVVINGKKIKSLNQWYNKRLAELRSIYDRTGVKKGKKLKQLLDKRDRRINDWFHKISHWTVEWCKENDIDTLVVGRNKNWKQRINLRKKTNQNFVSVPFHKLIKQLEYKCEEAGIHYIETGESYTSKCSFLDLEPLQKQKIYKGKRIKRGMFRSAKGHLINADVNGGYNIIRKVIPSAFNHWLTAEGLAGVGLHPKCEHVY